MISAMRQWLRPDEVAHALGGALPGPVLTRSVGAALGGLSVSLCLHRVGPRRPTDWQPGLSMEASSLDTLVDLLLAHRPGRADGWLSLSFDDGYRDAAEYVRSRAPRFPGVEFFFFVCPRKLETRAGFRWDAVEKRLAAGASRHEALRPLGEPHTVEAEAHRAELQGLADEPPFALVSVDEVRALAGLPNVRVGNHSNLHASPQTLSDDEAARDYRESREDFERLFGRQRDFAFPFGTPRHHFSQRHVDVLRRQGDSTIWTTEARPYRPDERRPGGVVPRFPVDGSRSPAELAGWIAARALKFRLAGSPHRF